MSEPEGLLVVDKPGGLTSHDVVARCRRLFGTRRVGHAGTLDPMATGVLVLGLGRATRLLGRITLADKEYDATVRLGQSTVTDDREGDVVASADASAVGDDDVAAAVAALTGPILQRPSSVSAVKVDGRRAYQRVRAGEEVELEPRPVTVFSFEVLAVRRDTERFVDVDVHVVCSTGTYVRALARDLGAGLGVGGHLTSLRRTRVGPYDIEQAASLEAIETGSGTLVPLERAAADSFASFHVERDQETGVRHGRAIHADLGAQGPVAVFGAAGDFLALYEQHGPVAKAVAVFAAAASPSTLGP